MKKLFIVAIATLLTSSVFTSCTENTTINDDQLIFEIHVIEQDERVGPEWGPLGEDDSNEEDSN